ncbi:MAG TPA: type II toxin-antitoxin system VapC family toxin [Candidatus Thermoplasmatota archaeon]|nr:type II toxin-antitoxin system VapC family toxin [Candidatus Thermoplasmatota archaeon]
MIVTDSSLLVAHLRGSKAATRFLKGQKEVVAPALVAWELWKGARTVAEHAAVRDLLGLCHVEPFSAALAESAGLLYREAEGQGRRRPAIDLLIASHALHRGCPVATLDHDYEGIPGLQVVKVKA